MPQVRILCHGLTDASTMFAAGQVVDEPSECLLALAAEGLMAEFVEAAPAAPDEDPSDTITRRRRK